MKTILLLRHAKSDWGDAGLDDFDRPLAKRGLQDAPRMGKLLAAYDCVPDQIIASPARRAKQTTELVAGACGYTPQIQWDLSFYEANHEALMVALQRLPAGVERPLLVGHNPALEETAGALVLGKAANLWAFRIPTAGLLCLEVDIAAWSALAPGTATLRWFVIPKLVKAIT